MTDAIELNDFKALLLSAPLDTVIVEHVLHGSPYAFASSPGSHDLLLTHLSGELSVDPSQIHVVGSGKLGFSLNPDHFPRPYSDKSDIDVAVVDAQLFDLVWSTLLRWHYPRRLSLPQPDREWMARRRKELYWGWFHPAAITYNGALGSPHILRPMSDLSAKWFNAFQSLGGYPAFSARKVSGRLYRSNTHAIAYIRSGLEQIRSALRDKEP